MVHPPLLLMNARPGPGVSLMITLFATDGPLFFTTMMNVTGPLAGSVVGPVLVMERSAFGVTVVVAEAVLLPPFESGDVEVTDAEFVTEVTVDVLTVYVALIDAPAPGARLAILQGNPEQLPVTGPAVVPAGVGSVTVMPVAVDGPLLIRLIEYVIVWPGEAEAGPVFAMATSELTVTAVITVELSFVEFGSVTPLAEAEAMLLTEPVAAGSTANVAVKLTVEPAVSVEIVQGKLAHGAVDEIGVSPAPGVSLTVTLTTFEGPLFVTAKL